MMQFNINTDAAVKFTNTLEKLAKSALPVAVRGTLDDAAFDVKTKTMPDTASKAFVNRNKTFFKANSKVERAQGFDMGSMKSTVGFFENKLVNQSTNYAVKDLEQQEDGGEIGGKSLIPMKTARVGNSKNKNVRPNYRIKNLGNVIDAKKVTAGNKKQKFIRAAFMATKLYGDAAFVLGNDWKGNRTLSKINVIWGSTRKQGNFGSRKLLIERTPLYTFRKGRSINVAGKNFMRRASLESGLKMDDFYMARAKKQIEKYYNK